MSEPERDDQRDQPGGEVVPFPGARAVPEVVADAALEPVPDALDGELVSEEEYARRTCSARSCAGSPARPGTEPVCAAEVMPRRRRRLRPAGTSSKER